jgi:hypothetical protein
MRPSTITLQPTGLNTIATLSVPQEDDFPRTFTGTGRNAALAISLAVKNARKAGFAGREWVCVDVNLKGVV